jgi:hypothetical protein
MPELSCLWYPGKDGLWTGPVSPLCRARPGYLEDALKPDLSWDWLMLTSIRFGEEGWAVRPARCR